MPIRALYLFAALVITGCSSAGPFDNPDSTPPKPAVSLREEVRKPNKYQPGFTVSVPQDWVYKPGLEGYILQVPGQDGNQLDVEARLEKADADKARDALAEHCAKVERAVSGGTKSSKGSFKNTLGRPVYWVRYPDGGGGGSHTVTTDYFISAADGHYQIRAWCDPSKTGSDLEAMTRACDYAAASAQFHKL